MKNILYIALLLFTSHTFGSSFTENDGSNTPFSSAMLQCIQSDGSSKLAVSLEYSQRERKEITDMGRLPYYAHTAQKKLLVPIDNFFKGDTTKGYILTNEANNQKNPEAYLLQQISHPVPRLTNNFIKSSCESFKNQLDSLASRNPDIANQYHSSANEFLYTILAQHQVLQSKTEGLYQELSEMEMQINAQTEYYQLRHKSQQLKEICKDLEKKRQEAEKKYQTAEEAFSIFEEINTRLQQGISNKEHELICIQNSKDIYEEKNAQLKEDLKKLESTLEESKSSLTQLKEKIALQNKVDLSQQISHLKEQIKIKENELKLKTQEINKLEKELTEATKNKEEEFKKEKKQLDDKIKQLEKELEADEKKIVNLNMQLHNLQEKIEQQKIKYTECSQAHEAALAKQKETHEEQLAQKTAALIESKEELNHQKTMLVKTKEEHKKSEAQINKLTNEMEQVKARLQSEIDKKEEEIVALKKEIQQREDVIALTMKEAKELIQAKKDDSETIKSNARQIVTQWEKKHQELKNEKEKIEKDLLEKNEAIQNLTSKIKQIEDNQSILNNEKNQLKQKINELQGLNELRENEKILLKTTIKENQEKITDLEKSITIQTHNQSQLDTNKQDSIAKLQQEKSSLEKTNRILQFALGGTAAAFLAWLLLLRSNFLYASA